MADRGRDLKVSILSDASRFDVDEPADQLENLGDAAKDTGSDLDKLGRDSKGAGSDLERAGRDARSAGDDLDRLSKDAKGAGDDLDRLGSDAKGTADKVEASFKQIGDASRKIGTDAKHGVDEAGEGLDEFKDEANSTAREAAASFDGSAESIADAFQEVAANAFAGFGPAGAAAGLAAAAGIGLVIKAFQSAQEASQQLKADAGELAGQMIDDGGRLTRSSIISELRKFVDEGTIVEYAKQAKEAGLDTDDFLLSMAGDPEALRRTSEEIDRRADAIRNQNFEQHGTEESLRLMLNPLSAVTDKISDSTKKHELAAAAVARFNEVQKTSVKSLEDYTDALDSVGDQSSIMADAIEAAAQRQADATEDAGDSAEDYRDRVVISVDDVIAAQQRQIQAALNFETNTGQVYERLGQDAVDWALSQGDSADEAMQALVNAPLEKGQQIAANYRQQMQIAARAGVDGFTSGSQGIYDANYQAGSRAGQGMTAGLSAQERSYIGAAQRLAVAASRELERDYHPTITPVLNMTPLRQSLSQELTARARP